MLGLVTRIADLISQREVPAILMHNRLTPSSAELRQRLRGYKLGVEYEDVLVDVKRDLLESVALARPAGVSDEHIILDPGIGF